MTPDTAIADPQAPVNQPPSTAGMTTKVVKGSLWTLVGQVAPLAVSLVTTPFTIRLLGAEGYGVLILIGLIPTYLGFADFGMSMAATKFGSEAYASGDKEKEARIVRTAALIALCSSVPIAALLMIFAGTIVSLFNVPAEQISDATLALRIASVTFVVGFLNTIFNVPQLIRLRMELNTMANAIPRILGLIATPIVIYLGFGVVGAITVLLIASLMSMSSHLMISRGLLRQLSGSTIERSMVNPMIKLGGALAIAGVTMILLNNIEKGILPAVVSVEALAYYSVAFTLATMMLMFSSAMVQSLIPAFSQLQASEKGEHLANLYSRGIRLTLMWLVPALVVLVVVGESFFTNWAGEEFGAQSTVPFYVLLMGLVFNIPAFIPYATIMASGRADIFTKLYIAEFVPYLVFVVALTYYFGAVGAAVAWSGRMIIDAGLQFIISKRIVGLPSVLRAVSKILLSGLIMSVPVVIRFYYGDMNLQVILILAICSALYGIILYKIGLNAEEVTWLKAKFATAGR